MTLNGKRLMRQRKARFERRAEALLLEGSAWLRNNMPDDKMAWRNYVSGHQFKDAYACLVAKQPGVAKAVDILLASRLG